MSYLLRVLTIAFVFQCTALSQTPPSQSPAVRRDPQAIQAVQNAVAVLGGANALAQLQSVLAQGSITSLPGVNDPSGTFVMEDQFSSQGHEFRDSFQSPTLTQIFVSGHGSPGLSSNGKQPRKFTPHMANLRVATHLPIYVLAELLAKPDCNIEFVGPMVINGQPAIQVHVHVDTDILQQMQSIQEWYFDPTSGLPLRVEYRLPDSSNALYFVPAAADLSDFRKVQGILFPFQITSYRDGVARTKLSISSVSANQPLASTDFDLPTAVAQ